MKVTKKLAEMHDGTVHLLSIVKAGASGAPFKRLKSEESEGEDDVFTPEKRAAVSDQPRLIALAVTKDGDVAATREIAKAAEIEILEEREVTSEDGDTFTLLITKSDTRVNTMDPMQVQVQLDENLIAICQVEKTFIPWTGSTSFADAIKAQGFFPQLSNALEVLGGVTYEILESASSPSVAAAEIAKSGEEFVTLLTAMAKALPKETFKMAEQLAKKDKPAEKTEPKEGDKPAEGTESLAEKDEGGDADHKSDANADKPAEKDDEKPEGEGDKKADAEKAEKPEGDANKELTDAEKAEAKKVAEKAEAEKAEGESDLAKVLTAIEALGVTVATQGEAHAALKEQVEAVALKADGAAEQAEKTESAVRGRVSGSPAPDGRRGEDAVEKGEPPLQDTGLAARRSR